MHAPIRILFVSAQGDAPKISHRKRQFLSGKGAGPLNRAQFGL